MFKQEAQRPTQIVHLRTMCHLFYGLARAAILIVFPIVLKNTNLVKDFEIFLPVKFRWMPFSGFSEFKHVSASQSPEWPSFSRSGKNTNFVEYIKILLLVKFRWIRFIGFRGEVVYVSANKRPGRPYFDRPEKHKFCSGYLDLAFCQVSLNSVQRFSMRCRKCLSQSETSAAILFFRSARSFFEFCLAVSEEELNMSQPIRGRSGHVLTDWSEWHKLGWRRWDLASC